MTRDRFKWSNIPIPEGHVILLGIGIGLSLLYPLRIFQPGRPNYALGWAILLLGMLLIAWCLTEVNEIKIDQPVRLITTGPYAFSRNPMYLAWTMIYIAAALIVNTWWLVFLAPVLLLYTHTAVVKREESQLESLFGKEYRQYRESVRRYL